MPPKMTATARIRKIAFNGTPSFECTSHQNFDSGHIREDVVRTELPANMEQMSRKTSRQMAPALPDVAT
ncbi:hypothetical protein AC579_5110 [Pseudocercospora musae]|uniref:Uncharacterized protein n=1 Tax=Pseudocercospora musae TaxID=113226 RepID=A0A139INI9_9PEZI|nr:hypothetical protein AC579_5110 [Pseudocercospora musae]